MGTSRNAYQKVRWYRTAEEKEFPSGRVLAACCYLGGVVPVPPSVSDRMIGFNSGLSFSPSLGTTTGSASFREPQPPTKIRPPRARALAMSKKRRMNPTPQGGRAKISHRGRKAPGRPEYRQDMQRSGTPVLPK